MYFVIPYECISKGKDITPLACAASKGNEKIVNYLLGQNVDVNDGNKVNYLIILLAKSDYKLVFQTTPLILASKNGHENIVKKLLQQPGIDVTIQNEDGYNCLALAAINKHLYVHNNIVHV